MIMKGGILLALGYDSSRYTKDIDFSTATKLGKFDLESFLDQFRAGLIEAVEQLDYGLDCRVQIYRQKPPRSDATFPTIRINVGYAYKNNTSAHKRLLNNNSTQIVQIDYSLNEPEGEPEVLEVEDGLVIRIYSFHDLVAEKFRALLQQEVRNRFRRQDIYDLNLLLHSHPLSGDLQTKERVLSSLRTRASARELQVNKESLNNPEIKRRSERDYETLSSEIEEQLPDFQEVFGRVRTYYESLPWGN